MLTDLAGENKLFLLTNPSSVIASLVTMEVLGHPCRSTAQMVNYLRLYKSIQVLRLCCYSITVEL